MTARSGSLIRGAASFAKLTSFLCLSVTPRTHDARAPRRDGQNFIILEGGKSLVEWKQTPPPRISLVVLLFVIDATAVAACSCRLFRVSLPPLPQSVSMRLRTRIVFLFQL
jgi:hypothetical protein